MGNAESGAAKETAEWCDKEAKGGVGGEIVSGGGVRGHLLEWQGFQGDEWQCASAVSREVDSDGRSATFTLMTFNVWFAQHRQVSRAEELLRVVKREKPDAVCLQEATVRFLKVFLADDYIRQTYLASSNVEAFGELNEASGYDSFMLCRPWCAGELRRYRLVSKFARCFYINVCKQFAVGTIHLESLVDNARNRALQMEQIYSLLQELGVADKTFFCGDLNHCTSLGEDHLRPSSIDVWPLLRPKEEGWTEDPRVNHMLASKPGKHPSVRFDRIIMTGTETGFEAREIRLLGNEPIQQLSAHKEGVDVGLSEHVFISDHFGLVASFAAKPHQ